MINRLCLTLSALSCGGAERVVSTMANYWANQGREITLITLSDNGDFFPLNPQIKRIALNLLSPSTSLWHSIKNNGLRLSKLRTAIRQADPNVIISSIDCMNVMTLAATRGLKIPVVVTEHTDPRRHLIGPIWGRLRTWFYPSANAVVVLTPGIKQWAGQIVPEHRVHIIHNPVLPTDNYDSTDVPAFRRPLVAAMGRLIPEKGFDKLLRAFASCNNDGWSLVIIGDGPERIRLEALARQLDIATRTFFPGRLREPGAVLQQAELFVLCSDYEGFPMALVEAMSHGLPAVSFACPSGPADIISDGSDGLLIPPGDIDALAAAMSRLMVNHAQRNRMGLRAKQVTQRFSVADTMAKWDHLLVEVTK